MVLEVPILTEMDSQDFFKFDLIVDAIFGFSFSGPIRPPFDQIIADIEKSQKPVICVDIPSGWDVEKGLIDQKGL